MAEAENLAGALTLVSYKTVPGNNEQSYLNLCCDINEQSVGEVTWSNFSD